MSMATMELFGPASRADVPVGRKAEQLLHARDGRRTTLRRIYDALAEDARDAQGPGVANVTLAQITPRYGARIHDLRALGCVIDTRQGENWTRYRMTKGLD